MAENVQVASLTAPITVEIPTQKIAAFQAQLEEIADTLEFIVEQLKDVTKEVNKGFKGMGKTLKGNNATQNKFIDGQKQINKEQEKTRKRAKRTSKVFGAWADGIAKARVGIGLLKFAIGAVLKLLAVPVTAFAGFTFLATKINSMTTKMSNLSKAVGLSLNDMKALTFQAKEMGFTFEHVNSLVEELNNKLGGEAGGFVEANLQEGLSSLAVSAEELQKLNPAQQLAKIMNASQALLKDGRMPELSSAFDKIFGQEGNRLLTNFALNMRDTGRSYEEIIEQNKRLVGISGEAESGAREWSRFFAKAKAAVSSFTSELFGRLGNKLKPFFAGFNGGFENAGDLIDKVLGKGFIDKLADGIIFGFKMISKAMTFLEDRDLEKDLEKIIEVLKTMTRIGFGLVEMFSELTPLVHFFTDLLTNDTTVAIIGWTAAIATAIGVSWGLFKALSLAVGGFKALLGVIVGLKAASVVLLPALAPFAPLLAVLAVGAAAITFGNWLGELDIVKETLSDIILAADKLMGFDLFGAGEAEARIVAEDRKMEALRARRELNRNRLSQGLDPIRGPLTLSPVDRSGNQAGNTQVNNVTNNIVVNDPSTGDKLMEEAKIVNPSLQGE